MEKWLSEPFEVPRWQAGLLGLGLILLGLHIDGENRKALQSAFAFGVGAGAGAADAAAQGGAQPAQLPAAQPQQIAPGVSYYEPPRFGGYVLPGGYGGNFPN